MKALFILFFLITAQLVFGQDTLFKSDGEVMLARVIEVTPLEVKVKKWDNLNGPLYAFDRKYIISIHYSDGTQEMIAYDAEAMSDPALYELGYQDAVRFYKGYKAIGTLTLITSLASPIAGLVPAAIGTNKSPDQRTFDLPNFSLYFSPVYMKGYADGAWKMKKRKIWTNLAIGAGVNISLIVFSLVGITPFE